MQVSVIFDDDTARDRATLIVNPSWLGRLFGHPRRVARIFFHSDTLGWRYACDTAEIEPRLRRIVLDRRRWHTRSDLPAARKLGDRP